MRTAFSQHAAAYHDLAGSRRRYDQAPGVPAGRVAAVSKTYDVRARRWKRGWELHIDGVGVTQSRSLSEAEGMVRDYIALDFDVEPDSFDVVIVPEIGDGFDERIEQVRRSLRDAERAQAQAAERSRALVGQLAAQGLSGKDIAKVMGISPQRVSQLLKATSDTTGTASSTPDSTAA